MQQYISAPYMFSLQALTEVANFGITHYNGFHAGPGLVDCGGGCSCLLLPHSSPTCTDAGSGVCSRAVLGANIYIYIYIYIYTQSISTCANTA